MIIASDGLWDVMNNDSVINLVKEQLQTTDDLGAIAQSLIDEAKKRKSGDNITVSVVMFNHHKKGKTPH
jgi:protein phosphatase 2C family protein 2/3